MRLFFLISTFGILTYMASCTQQVAKVDDSKPFVVDSTKINRIDTLCYLANQEGNQPGKEYSLKPHVYHENDDIRVFEKDGQLVRVVANFFPDSMQLRYVFYLKDGQLAFVRDRHWEITRTPWSRETLSYLENGEVFCAFERRANLAPNQPPTAVLVVPYSVSPRKRSEVVAGYASDWEAAKKAIEDYKKVGKK